MKRRVVTTLRQFEALASPWQSLTTASGQASPFLSHDWFACCWRTAGPERAREAWVLEDGGGPVALVPLLRARCLRRGLPVRLLTLMDAPDTPFVDIPTVQRVDRVVETLLDTLADDADWDVWSVTKLPADSPTLAALERALDGRFPWRIAATTPSPYVGIEGTWQEFLASKSQRFRKTCRHTENRLRARGDATVEEHERLHPDGRVFAEIMEVSRQSWKGPRGVAMATMEGMPRFFRELTVRASANGWLHVWILRLDGRVIGMEYQIRTGATHHALRADFDACLGDLSPGAFLNLHIVRSLFERKQAREYDMGPGLNEYKSRWATSTHETVTLEVYAPTAYGRLLHAVEARLVPYARQWRARLRKECA